MRTRLTALVVIGLIVTVAGTAPRGSGSRAPAQGWVSHGPPGGDIADILAAPDDPERLYAVIRSENGQVFISQDSGQSWTRLTTFSEPVYSMAIDPSDPSVMYVLGKEAVWKTADGGAGWTRGVFASSWYGEDGEIAVHPLDPQLVFATGYQLYEAPVSGASGAAFFKSVDGGESWSSLCLDRDHARGQGLGLAVNPLDAGEIFIAGYETDSNIRSGRLYKSGDGGTTWTDLAGSWEFAAEDVLVDPVQPATVLVATPWCLLRSTDGALTWTSLLGGKIFHTLTADPLSPNTFYAGGDNVLWRSVDGGVNWTDIQLGYVGTCQALLARGQVLYYGSPVGIWKSPNSGMVWEFSQNGLNAANVQTVLAAPTLSQVAYAVSDRSIVMRTVDGGESWALASRFAPRSLEQIVIHPTNPNVLYAITSCGET